MRSETSCGDRSGIVVVPVVVEPVVVPVPAVVVPVQVADVQVVVRVAVAYEMPSVPLPDLMSRAVSYPRAKLA